MIRRFVETGSIFIGFPRRTEVFPLQYLVLGAESLQGRSSFLKEIMRGVNRIQGR